MGRIYNFGADKAGFGITAIDGKPTHAAADDVVIAQNGSWSMEKDPTANVVDLNVTTGNPAFTPPKGPLA